MQMRNPDQMRKCKGGPYSGRTFFWSTPGSFIFKVGKWNGHYDVEGNWRAI